MPLSCISGSKKRIYYTQARVGIAFRDTSAVTMSRCQQSTFTCQALEAACGLTWQYPNPIPAHAGTIGYMAPGALLRVTAPDPCLSTCDACAPDPCLTHAVASAAHSGQHSQALHQVLGDRFLWISVSLCCHYTYTTACPCARRLRHTLCQCIPCCVRPSAPVVSSFYGSRALAMFISLCWQTAQGFSTG